MFYSGAEHLIWQDDRWEYKQNSVSLLKKTSIANGPLVDSQEDREDPEYLR